MQRLSFQLESINDKENLAPQLRKDCRVCGIGFNYQPPTPVRKTTSTGGSVNANNPES
jgi:hypothetical protein